MNNIFSLMENNPYPGRGILIGCTKDGKSIIAAYFIMGRSENSRNRVFIKTDDGISTKAYDFEKLTDPSLIIYSPVRTIDNQIIITNGDQTDTVYDHLSKGLDFRSAILSREYEPDAPNFTPRISGLVNSNGSYILSIIKKLEVKGVKNDSKDNKSTNGHSGFSGCQHNFFEYSNPIPGLGHFISTYETDGDPLPSFIGEPIPINLSQIDGIDNFSKKLWKSLSKENKVSLYTKMIELSTREVSEAIINKHE